VWNPEYDFESNDKNKINFDIVKSTSSFSGYYMRFFKGDENGEYIVTHCRPVWEQEWRLYNDLMQRDRKITQLLIQIEELSTQLGDVHGG
jgi:hypothetical protein